MNFRMSACLAHSWAAPVVFLIFGLLAGSARAATAEPLVIQDASFDNRSLAAGAFSAALTPWQETGGTGNGNGFIERITRFAANGQNHLGMNLNHNVWQDLGVTYQANTRYTLTVATGNRSTTHTHPGNQSSYLLAASDGTIFATGTFNASTIPAGTFAEAPPLTLETTPNSRANGKTIRILLQARGSGRSHFDNIRLTAESTVLPQTITFDELAPLTAGDPPVALSATASSGLAVSYSSSDPAVASLSGNLVTAHAEGTVTITAKQAGNAGFLPAAPVARTLTVFRVGRSPQTIDFPQPVTPTVGNRPFALTATASSGLPVTFASSNAAVASISGTTVTLNGAGSAIITASQAGDFDHLPATPVQRTVVVNAASGGLSITPSPLALTVRSGETISAPLNLQNATEGQIDWRITAEDNPGNPEDFEGQLHAVSISGNTLNGPLPLRYDFTGSGSGATSLNVVPTGSSGSILQGNRLHTNLGGPLPYSHEVVTTSAVLGPQGRYFTHQLPGLFVLAAEADGIEWFEVNGSTNYYSAKHGSSFEFSTAGRTWSAFVVTHVLPANTINQLVLVDQPGLQQEIGSGYSQQQRITGLSGKRRIYQFLFITKGTEVQPQPVFTGMATRFLEMLPGLSTRMTFDPADGSSAAHGVGLSTARFDAISLPETTYQGTMRVQAPAGGLLSSVPVSVTVTAPRMEVPVLVNYEMFPSQAARSIELPLASKLPGEQPWAAAIESPVAWLTIETPSGTTPEPLRLRLDPATLDAGDYSARVTVRSGPATYQTSVSLRIRELAISRFVTDSTRPLVYAIHKNGVDAGALLVFDSITRRILHAIPTGKEPTDCDLSEDGSKLWVINSKDPSLMAVSTTTWQVVETIPLAGFSSRSRGSTEPGAHIKCGKGSIVYYVDEQWGPRLRVFDTATRALLQTLSSTSGKSPDSENNFGYGGIALNPARTRLFGWAQYGDGAGFSSTHVVRFDIKSDGTLDGFAKSASYSGTNFKREPLDAPVLFTPDGSRLVIKDREVDQANPDHFPTIYLDEVYSLARNGSVATSAGAIHDFQTAELLAALPAITTVQALLPDLSALVYFNSSDRTIGWFDLETTLGAPALGLAVTPANGTDVINPTRLEWPSITGIERYRIYLGTNENEVMAATPGSPADLGETSATFFNLPAPLAAARRYFWRVVPIGSDGIAAGAGTVRSFTAASFQLSPSSFGQRLPLTIAPQTISIAVTGADGQPAAWTLNEAIPWFLPDATTGNAGTPLTGRISASGLTAGTFNGSLGVTAAGMTLDLPLTVNFYEPELVALKSDPSSDWVYGLHRGSSTANESQILAIRAATGAVEKALPVGGNAQDFAISPTTGRLYVSNTGQPRMQVVDLAAFKLLPSFTVPDTTVGVAADSRGRVFACRDGGFTLLDATSGALIGQSNSGFAWGLVDPAGSYYYTTITGTNAALLQFDVSDNNPVRTNSLNLYGNNSQRPVLSADGKRLFSWSRAFDSGLRVIGAAGEPVRSTVSNGRLAVGANSIWWVNSAAQAASLPFNASLSTVSRGDQFLLLYNATTRAVTSVRLNSLVPFPGLAPEPGESLAPGQPAELSWPTAADAVSYRVFLGTTEAEIQAAAAGSDLELGTTATTSWSLNTPPSFGNRYFWRIDAIQAGGTTVKGTVWWFDVPMPELAPALTVAPANSNPAGLSMNLTEFGIGMTHLQDWGHHSLRIDPDNGRPSPWQSFFNYNWGPYPGLRYVIGQQTAVLAHPSLYSSSSPGANDGKLTLQKLAFGRWLDTATLGPPSLPDYARLGSSLAYDGNIFMAGMPGGAAGGRVAIYREYPEFAFMQEIKPSDGAVGDNFGASIALQGNRALIGAPGGWTTSGKGYIFEFQPATRTWLQRAALVPASNSGVDNTHGAALALDGDTAVLSTGSSSVNQVTVFTRSPSSSWAKTATLANPKGTTNTNGYGFAVALAGDTLFVSDLSAIVRGAEAGIVHVFHRSGSTWRLGAAIQPPVGVWRFGYALAARNGVLYVSSSTGLHSYRIADLPNRVPRFPDAPPAQFVAGRTLDLEINASDADGTAGLTFQADSLPAGVSLENLGGGRARLAGAPTGAPGTSHFLRWKATDSAGASVYQTSQVTLLSADQLPVLAAGPLTQQPPVGSDIVLTAAATGIGPFRWQWLKDGVELPGATGPRLILNEVTAAESGTYAVTVGNVVGSVTSAAAVVTVRPPTLNAGNWETVGNSPAHHGHHAAALTGYRLMPAWTNNLGDSFSGALPVIADGRVHVLGSAYSSSAPLRTLDLATGGELWNFPISASSYISPPSVRNGRVYFQEPGVIHSLNAATGASEWTNPTFSSQGFSYGPLAVTDEGIFAINGYFGSIMGFESTGEIRFSADLSATDGWAPAVFDGRVFTWANGTFREHSPGDGSVIWSLANLGGDASFAVRSGCAVLSSQTGLSCVDINSRALRWQTAGNFRGLPAIAGGRAFATQTNVVRSFALADGTPGPVYQTTATASAPLTNQPIILHDRLIATSLTTTWVFNLADGSLVQTLAAGGVACYANGHLLAVDNDGILRAFIALNSNPKLASLELNPGGFMPDFNSQNTSYLATVPFDTDAVTITAATEYPNATVKINGVAVTSASASRQVHLDVGGNLLKTVVTAEDGVTTMTYTIAVTRLPRDFVFNSSDDIPLTADGFLTGNFPVNIILNHPPAPGTTLTMVNNTALGHIDGRFSNLAQGRQVWLSHAGVSYAFVANYHGGTGNDLVLQWAGTRLASWGLNNYGQLGDGGSTTRLAPTAVDDTGLLSGKTILAVSTGYLHSVALCSDGVLAAWGYNVQGQLGDRGTAHQSVPVAVDLSGVLADKRVVAISSGSFHNLALCSDGSIAAWGYNNHGQLGDGTKVTARSPVLVNTAGVLAGKQVVAVAAGAYQSYALCSDGTLAAWGYNDEGELGDGGVTGSPVPVAVNAGGALAGRKVASIAAGQYHTLALCTDGTLAAWGFNRRGQLGNSSTADSALPVAIGSFGALAGKSVSAIAAGASHSLAWCDDGTLAAWGLNSQSQLGATGITQSAVPVAVSLPANIAGRTTAAISAGAHHNLLRLAGGRMAAWGGNSSGQLGTNSSLASAVALEVDTSALQHDGLVMFAASGNASWHNLAVFASPVAAPATGLAAWNLENFSDFGSGDPRADVRADCDGDGVPNLVEYAFGLDPRAHCGGDLPQPRLNGDRFELRFNRAMLPSDVEHGVEWSPDLQPGSWRDVPDTGNADEHLFSLPADTATRLFMRHRVRPRNSTDSPDPGLSAGG